LAVRKAAPDAISQKCPLWVDTVDKLFSVRFFWYRGEREKCDFNNINHLLYHLFCSIGEPAREMDDFRSLSTVSTHSGHFWLIASGAAFRTANICAKFPWRRSIGEPI